MHRTDRRWGLLPSDGQVAVGLSGGIDSLALVWLLVESNRRSAARRELVALHVPVDAGGESAPLPPATAAWCLELGVGVEEVEARLDPGESSLDCFACGRIRRRSLLEAADARGIRHLALGHHADDVVETWLMSLFYTGTAETMAPVRSYFSGAVEVVRPLYEIQRGRLARLARLAGFPPPASACPQEGSARRERVAAALGALGGDERRVRRQLYWAAVRTLGDPPKER